MSKRGSIKLRPAVAADIPVLEDWDTRQHVIQATTDDPDAASAGNDWEHDLEIARTRGPAVWELLIAELDGRPIGIVQIIDPHTEPTHYWGDIEPNLRAIDIWIGEEGLLGQGYGTEMMRQAIDHCFADPAVQAIVIDPLKSNMRAIRFYRRLGFVDVGSRVFLDTDHCLVMRLDRTTWVA